MASIQDTRAARPCDHCREKATVGRICVDPEGRPWPAEFACDAHKADDGGEPWGTVDAADAWEMGDDPALRKVAHVETPALARWTVAGEPLLDFAHALPWRARVVTAQADGSPAPRTGLDFVATIGGATLEHAQERAALAAHAPDMARALYALWRAVGEIDDEVVRRTWRASDWRRWFDEIAVPLANDAREALTAAGR